MADQTPELDGASEEALELELEPEVTPKEEPEEPGGDPLDEISDPVVRAQAKKDRAIARRLAKKEDKPEKTDTSKFLTKEDFYKSNERKAIREITADAEIKAVWNEIIPFYTPRRGKETPEDIVEDIRDAITLYKVRNPAPPEKDDSANDLTASPVMKTGGGVTEKVTPKPKDPPNFKLPTDPKSWYKKS